MSDQELKKQKDVVRKKVLTLLKNQEEDKRHNKSLIILDKLFNLAEFKKAQTILFYASFRGEVETFEMICKAGSLGKRIALPTIDEEKREIFPVLIHDFEKDLIPGPYGIMQPRIDEQEVLALDAVDMVVVPGVAFDCKGNRLGRGAGYYDRFLKLLPEKVSSVGLAFDFQILDHLPADEQDVPVSQLIYN